MSLESVRGFLNRVETDPAFAANATECKQVQELVLLARTEGFDFEVDEFIEATRLSAEEWANIFAEVIEAIFPDSSIP